MAAAPRSSWELSSPKREKGNKLQGTQQKLCKKHWGESKLVRSSASRPAEESLPNSSHNDPNCSINCLLLWQTHNSILTAAAPLLHSSLFIATVHFCHLPLSWKDTCYGAKRRVCRMKAVDNSRAPIPEQFASLELWCGKPTDRWQIQVTMWVSCTALTVTLCINLGFAGCRESFATLLGDIYYRRPVGRSEPQEEEFQSLIQEDYRPPPVQIERTSAVHSIFSMGLIKASGQEGLNSCTLITSYF